MSYAMLESLYLTWPLVLPCGAGRQGAPQSGSFAVFTAKIKRHQLKVFLTATIQVSFGLPRFRLYLVCSLPFGVSLQLFHMLLKKAKILFGSEEHARMVDPFVRPLTDALSSEHVPLIIESLICLTFVIKFKGTYNRTYL